ncbi:DUF3307 domain-containing protein [Salegentibacter salegens]|uniref:DUF3307 domain-containing protein n=1 Tax=Salegentibacter salegens TaxID=143223 RepID=A0A1M7J4Q7_9FLAO|nr:DUF3307 domain-containing protein [Salegentibacter salegens]PRX47378.1 uncharacterized protein DUF3307 [Salegentibacter salegens]SHM47397.1 Protein of unknown function [Salegentibacter salegens]
MEETTLILLQLLLAHILTDFVLQPTKLVKHKREKKAGSWFLYFHSFLAGFLTYIFLQEWHLWYIPIVISLSHFFIDLWKLQHKNDTLKLFLIDQFWHIFIIILVWIYLIDGFSELIPFIADVFSSTQFLAIIIGYLLVIFPTGFLIGKATKRWHNELQPNGQSHSLEAAGRYIGIFERILVLTFILTQNFSAIGFLIAAKSILRFSDKTDASARKQTEYVLIGTLMSFAITILIGLLVRYFLF